MHKNKKINHKCKQLTHYIEKKGKLIIINKEEQQIFNNFNYYKILIAKITMNCNRIQR